MTKDEFKKHMDRLIDVYSESNYPSERIKLIFREVDDLSGVDWGKIVDDMIGRFQVKYPPLLPDIRQASNSIRAKNFQTEVKQASRQLINHGRGLDEYLKSIDANNLVEALKKVRA